MKQVIHTIRAWVVGHQLHTAVALALLIGGGVACLGLWIYDINDVSLLDISRPGYESARKSVQREDDVLTFDANGALDGKALDTFESLFSTARKSLDANGSFGSEQLSDTELGISPQSSPETN